MVLIGCATSRPRSRGYHLSKHGKFITSIQYVIAILSVNLSPNIVGLEKGDITVEE